MPKREHWQARYEGFTGARVWARWMLEQDDLAILDTETTGLESTSEVISVAAIDRRGGILLNQLVRPLRPIPEETIRFHGIFNADLLAAPSFDDLYPQLAALFASHRVVIYNANYDMGRLDYCLGQYGLPDLARPVHCAMEAYAAYWGDWSDYHQSYKWQKLAIAAGRYGYDYQEHVALEDCRATLVVMRGMAKGK